MYVHHAVVSMLVSVGLTAGLMCMKEANKIAQEKEKKEMHEMENDSDLEGSVGLEGSEKDMKQ